MTKRHLGIFIALIGLAAAGGTVAVDAAGAGEWGGFGPLQQIALGVGLVALVVGIILICVGNRPA